MRQNIENLNIATQTFIDDFGWLGTLAIARQVALIKDKNLQQEIDEAIANSLEAKTIASTLRTYGERSFIESLISNSKAANSPNPLDKGTQLKLEKALRNLKNG